jgi:ParB family chromosome partitioning protein
MNVVTLRLDDILIPSDRLRALEEEKAQSIAASIDATGQFQPIAVYRSNAAVRPYTLIFGLHRLRAIEILGQESVNAIVRTADEALQIETAENLFRNDLNEIDRAVFADKWAEFKGVKMGRPPKAKEKSDIFGQLFGGRFVSDSEAARLGLTGRQGRRLRQIAKNLNRDEREVLRHTPAATNQAHLLKIARMEPTVRRGFIGVVQAMGYEAAWMALKPERSKISKQARAYEKFLTAWSQMNAATRQKALADIGAKIGS